jgi:hypothetical protein
VALPVPFINNFYLFAGLVWLLLFFGGFIVPIMTGLLLSIVKPTEKTVANSIANLSYNILGYLPSPFLYGIVCEFTGGSESRYGLILLMFAAIPSMLCCFGA